VQIQCNNSLSRAAELGIRFGCVNAQECDDPYRVLSGTQSDPEAVMATDSTPGTFEECADELLDFINTLDRYPHALLAFALRAHLSGLLQALLLHGGWTRDQIISFLADMEEEILSPEDEESG
jgi:hypothetical protein